MLFTEIKRKIKVQKAKEKLNNLKTKVSKYMQIYIHNTYM